ncbi:unnamed protein product, partial [Rotaria sordida]
QAENFITKLNILRITEQQEIGFTFVESEFIQAIREGWWILLDNVNCAPLDVLERLNSLTEDNPMLSLYENSKGEILRENQGIHSNFRLFTTANLNRIYSNKLSSAFLNRVIRICLPQIDDFDIKTDNDPTTSDLYELLSTQLTTIPAGTQLAHLLMLTHLNVKQDVKDNVLIYPSDFSITYRLLEQCIHTIFYLISRKVKPVDACYWSLIRCYCSSLQNHQQYKSFITKLQQTIDKLNLRSSSIVYSTALDELDRKQALWIQESQRIRSKFISFERYLVELIFNMIKILTYDNKFPKLTCTLFILFIDNILLLMSSSDPKLIQLKQTLTNNDNLQIDLDKELTDLMQQKNISIHIDFKQTTNKGKLIQRLISDSSLWLCSTCEEISTLLELFIRNTSFIDTHERLEFLQRAISIIDIFHQFFSSSIFALFDRTTELTRLCSSVIQYLRPLLAFKDKCSAYALFHDPAFIDAKYQFRVHLFENFDSSLVWSFERAQSFPIRSTRKDLRKLIEHMVNTKVHANMMKPIQYFATLLEWISLQWTFDDYLTISVRNALQKNVCITRDFILESELKFSALELSNKMTTIIGSIVRDLPSESSSINTNYSRLKKELELKRAALDKCKENIQELESQLAESESSKQNEINVTNRGTPNLRSKLSRDISIFHPDENPLSSRLNILKQEQIKLKSEVDTLNNDYNRSSHNRTAALDKAIAAREKLYDEMKNLLESDAYKFVHEQLEQSDAKQLNHFLRLLSEARKNPTLINRDGLLDTRAILATSFGRELIEHDDILESSLIFFLFGYYFLPYFDQRYRFFIISNWQQINDDIDINTLNLYDLIIYCPNKNPYQCCLLSITKQNNIISIIISSIQYIYINELRNVLNESLPDGIQCHIKQKEFEHIKKTITENGQELFGLACLMYLYQQDDITSTRINEIYDQIKIIFGELKYFVEHNAIERKTSTVLIYQNIKRFQNDLDSFNLSNNSDDLWVTSIQQMWTLIKPYQEKFSSTVAQKLQEELQYSIQSIEPPNLSSRLTSLGYLEPLKEKYGCVHMIIQHLKEGMNSTAIESIPEFHILFNFVNKILKLLKLLIQHTIFGKDDYINELYENTPFTIHHLEHIFHSTLFVINIVNNQLQIGVTQTKSIFDDLQIKLDEYLLKLKFSNNLLIRYNLTNLIRPLATLFDPNRRSTTIINTLNDISNENSSIMRDPLELRRKQMQSQIDETIKRLNENLIIASQLPIQPQPIIQRIHTALHKLKIFDINQDDEKNFKWLIHEERTLADLLQKFNQEINQYTTFNVTLPDDESIHEINETELSFNINNVHILNYENELKFLQENIKNSSQGNQFNELSNVIRLTNAHVSSQTWLRAACLLKSDNKDELRDILMKLNNDLVMQLERGLNNEENKNTFIDNFAFAYAQFRSDLLNVETKQGMLSNYIDIAKLVNSIQQWTKKTNLNIFNMFDNIKKISDDLNLAENRMQNFTTNVSCSLLPIDIRPEDLICLFIPEYTSIMLVICEKFNQINEFLSGRINKIEPLQLPSFVSSNGATNGLSSFIYRDQSTSTPLFDRQKHILEIRGSSTKFIQQLIALFMEPKIQTDGLMNVSTSVKELFPIQIALSFALLILTDWIALKLDDFNEHIHLLTMTTLKEKDAELQKMKTNIYYLEQDLNNDKQNLEKISKDYENAEIDLECNKRETYSVRDRLQQLVDKCLRDKTNIEIQIQMKEEKISNDQHLLNDELIIYKNRLKQEQDQWLFETVNYLKGISEKIITNITDIINKPMPNNTSKTDITSLLNNIVDFCRQNLLEPTKTNLDTNKIQQMKNSITSELDNIKTHVKDKIVDNDPMYSFIFFYCDLICMSLDSLVHSTLSWNKYIDILKTTQMIEYAQNKKKIILCNLNRCTNDECKIFLDQVRSGEEQTKVLKHAYEISRQVHTEVTKLDMAFTGQHSKHIQYLIREFKRFVGNLLYAGCLYSQLQYGIREPFSEYLVGIENDIIDSRLPRSESDLLKLLETCELQLKSHSDALIYQTLHIAFTFSSNSFSLFDEINRSVKELIQLVLPSAHLISRSWLTIDTLIHKICQNVTIEEVEILKQICKDFSKFTNETCEINNQSDFINKQLESDLFKIIWKHIEQLVEILVKNRPKMKIFNENLLNRWHRTMKEIFRGFIQARKFNIQRQLEWNQRNVKQISTLLNIEDATSNTKTNSIYRLADIERALQQKTRLLTDIDTDHRSSRLNRLQHLEIFYQLTIGGIDNLEAILMNMPIHHIDLLSFFKLLNSTRELYKGSEINLLEQPLIHFINDDLIFKNSFQLLDGIYRLEQNVFQDLYEAAKIEMENRFNEFQDSIKFESIFNIVKLENNEWNKAGENFICLRKEKRKKISWKDIKGRIQSNKTLQTFVSHLPFVSTSPSHIDINILFQFYANEILLYMAYHQKGNDFAFSLAPQEEVKDFINLYSRYKNSFKLSPIDQTFSLVSGNISWLLIKCSNTYLTRIDLQLLVEDDQQPEDNIPSNQRPPDTSNNTNTSKPVNVKQKKIKYNIVSEIPVFLTSKETAVKILISLPRIDVINIKIDNKQVFQMEWWKFAVSQREHNINQYLNIKYFQSNKEFYVTKLTLNTQSTTTVPLSNQIKQNLIDLEEQIINQLNEKSDDEAWKTLIANNTMQKFNNNMNQIVQLSRCLRLTSNDLLNSINIYNLFNKLPKPEIQNNLLDLIPFKDFSAVAQNIHIVDDFEPALEHEFSRVWTRSMDRSFQSIIKCRDQIYSDIYLYVDHLRLNKCQLFLLYACANTLSNNMTSSIQSDFNTMLAECTKFCELKYLDRPEYIQHLEECQRLIYEAQRIYRTMKRSSNNWIEINDLFDLSSFKIETNLSNAFLYSQMSRDTHIWLVENIGSDATPTIMTCHPKPAILDFGVALPGIHQRMTQRIYIHNEVDRDLKIKIDRSTKPMDTPFDVTTDNLQLTPGDICELEVILRPPTNICSLKENWDLIVDDQIKLSNTLQAQAEIVEIDLKISTETIDFGLVSCNSHRIVENIQLENILPYPVRVKAQLKLPETNQYNSILTMVNNELNIPAKSKISFGIALEASKNIEEDIEADVFLAVDSPKNIKAIRINAKIRQILLEIHYQGRSINKNQSQYILTMNNFYRGERRILPIEFFNNGPIEYTLRLNSQSLKLSKNEVQLPVDKKENVNIEIYMPNDRISHTFILEIGFLNNKHQYYFMLPCEIAEPKMTYTTSNPQNKHIIHIIQKGQMELIQDKNLGTVQPISQEVKFKNTSKATVTFHFLQTITAQDPPLPLSSHFKIEPDNVIIQPNGNISVQFIYYPIDLRPFNVNVQLQSNTSPHPINIPYSVEYHTPILRTTPHSVIDIGLIKSGTISKKEFLKINNIGKKDLRFEIYGLNYQEKFVQSIDIQKTGSKSNSQDSNPTIKISQGGFTSLDINIQCDQVNLPSEYDMTRLFEFELVSLCDPVIDVDSKLDNRRVKIIIIGHMKPLPAFVPTPEENPKEWSSLELLPSQWLHYFSQQYKIYQSYTSLIILTAIAYICGSQKTKDNYLPLTLDDWTNFCLNLNSDIPKTSQEKLKLNDFDDVNTISRAIDNVIKHLRLSLNNYISFFQNSILFHDSFTNNDVVRLQLFSVINSAANVDEAYTMQLYTTKFYNIYENSSPENASQQAIKFIYQCIANDSAISEEVRIFIKFIRNAIRSSTTFNIQDTLKKHIPSTNTFRELLTMINDSFRLKWTILFELFSDRVRTILVKLINADYQALLEIHLKLENEKENNTLQGSLLNLMHKAHDLWSTLNETTKFELFLSIFDEHKMLYPLITSISIKNQARLCDIVAITAVIFEKIDPSFDFTPINDVFQKPYIDQVRQALGKISHISSNNNDYVMSHMRTFRLSLQKYPSDDFILSNGKVESYCSILNYLIPLTYNQKTFVNKTITIIWNILCDASKSQTTIANIVNQILHLLHILNEEKNWLSIQESYYQHYMKPSWETMLTFISTIGCNNEIISYIKKLTNVHEEETMINIILEIGRFISTNDELISFNKYQSSIKSLKLNTTSTIELLEKLRNIVPQEFQEQIQAYLTITSLPNISKINDEDQYQILDNIVNSWIRLLNIKGADLRRLFETISSILTSFHGLIVYRHSSLNKALYTTSLTSALCTLSNYRQRTREKLGIDISTIQSNKIPSILTTIQQTLVKIQQLNLSISSAEKSQDISSLSSSLSNSGSTSKTIPTNKTTPSTESIQTSLYSMDTLKKMQDSVIKYVQSPLCPSFRFNESDKIHTIIIKAHDYCSQVTQWYGIFTTFNVLVHNQSNINNLNQNEIAHNIILHGLQLLRDLIIIKKILEPIFSITGVRFLIKDLNRLEKCFLSLSLENYFQLRETLRQLNIDVSSIVNDFPPPSKTRGRKGELNKRKIFDMLEPNVSKPLSTLENQSQTTKIDDDTPLTLEDWRATTQNESPEKIKDILELSKLKSKSKSNKRKMGGDSKKNLLSNIEKLAKETSSQSLTKVNVSTTSHTNDGKQNTWNDIDGSIDFNIDLQMKAMQEQLKKQPNLLELYESIKTKGKRTPPDGKLDNRATLISTIQRDRWTYQLLVETPPIARMINLIIKEFRSKWETLINNINTNEQHELHWCIMIDNSGSMSIYRNSIYEILVILMELHRKLESKFSVARFGGRNNQKMLKNMTDRFTIQDGQFVLEALTFDEGTYPATGLDNISNRVFGIADENNPSNPLIHRLVLMITDGLTHDNDDTTYTETIKKYDINLGVLFIETAGQSTSQVLLRGLKKAQYRIVHANDISQSPKILTQLMHDMVKTSIKTDNHTTITNSFPTINIKIPNIPEKPFLCDTIIQNLTYDSANPTSYMISSSTAIIPRLNQSQSQLTNYLSLTTEYTDYSSKALNKLREYYHTLKVSTIMQDIEKNWISEEYRLSGVVEDVSTVLGDLVLPFNKFTRRRAALRGSSLYLPGLIKAMTSEWTYKKIFSSKLAGGKRDHAVCLVLDVSTSMLGTLSTGLKEAIIVLTAALRKLDLTQFGIIIFGREVRLIKSNEQLWDATTIYTLVNELRFDQDEDTKDADAIETAIDLLSQCSTRGEKKIFIFTDGYSNCGNRLAMVQQRAENNSIDLIAMAIGIDPTNLQLVYKRYLQCATVRGLSKALRALFEQEAQIVLSEWAPIDNDKKQPTDDTKDTISKDNLFEDIVSKKAFSDMINELAGERELMLMQSGQPPSNITIDICFCLDCTGSMSRWLAAVKGQMKTIMEGIQDEVKVKYPSLKLQLRFAIVAYRDLKDKPPIMKIDFTEKTVDVMKFLNGITASGGGDIPEDVLSALDTCLTLNWSKTNARFIVLITDAPGHGPELNNDLTNDHYNKGNGKHTLDGICDRLLKKNEEIDLMFCVIKPKATAKMMDAFKSQYTSKASDAERAFKDIKLFDTKQLEAQSYHFVFVLDESGSMDSHWNELQKAYNNFLTRRNDDQGGDDVITIVQFDSSARTICLRRKVADAPRTLSIHGGGTDYAKGLKEATKEIDNDKTKASIVMIFMSDGADGGSENPENIITQLKSKYTKDHNFICHTIGFGGGIRKGSEEEKKLKRMADNGGGEMYKAETGNELIKKFEDIAANSTTSSALIERFSEILSRDINTKIMIDYL